MKIYNYINFTKNTNAITASEYIAKNKTAEAKKKGEHVQLWEGELKTQGSNFHTWANGWKRIDE